MLDSLGIAFQRIHNTIPEPILQATFEEEGYDLSIDEQIKRKVLIPRVLPAVSIRGGKILRLILDEAWMHPVSSPSRYALGIAGGNSVYHVPPEAREHRDIVAVFELQFPFSLGTTTAGSGLWGDCVRAGNSLSGLACAALQSQTYANMLVRPTPRLYPGNVIVLEPAQISVVPWKVHCRLKYDENFSGMDVSVLQPFANVCEYAVKAYIYTNMLVKIESNLVFRGAEIGVIKDIVSSYSEAAEKYEEHLLAMGGAEILDPSRLENVLRKMTPKR